MRRAEAAFAGLFHLPHTPGVDVPTHETLRDLLRLQRCVHNTGVEDMETFYDMDRRRRCANERRAKLALDFGCGAAVGKPSAAEYLFATSLPMPICERWPDAFVDRLVRDDTALLHERDILGHDGRTTLPHASYADAPCGPSALVDRQILNPTLQCISYLEISTAVDDIIHGKRPVDTPTASHSGQEVSRVDELYTARDAAALHADGLRVWPPRALRPDSVAATTAAVAALARRLPSTAVSDEWQGVSRGSAGVRTYVNACASALAEVEQRDVFLGLGVCAHQFTTHALNDSRRRALTVAANAYVRGQIPLGDALVVLANCIGKCM